MMYQVFVVELGRKLPVGEPVLTYAFAESAVATLRAAGKRAHMEVQCRSQGRVSA